MWFYPLNGCTQGYGKGNSYAESIFGKLRYDSSMASE